MANIVQDLFSTKVFDDATMKERLPVEAYRSLHKTIKHNTRLDSNVANVVANAMKEWALENGATHYTHWFQPMTNITAEKHDCFISPKGDGKIIMEFSGKELIKGETDGSSFPSGGLRATFEARGYTAWDVTSYAFIKDDTLCIPTIFCTYGGEALDQKSGLIRSMETIDRQALRVVKLFGNEDVRFTRTTVGPEQEYFLIDKEIYEKRKDLIYTGRTLFGCRAPKGQELDDHYFGAIKPRVQAFMRELDEELWKLGVLAKTEHNEVAPGQHELAVIYEKTNLAADHNQLTMEMMQKIAARHNMVCLLHEKPFAGVNGSGKHNNWSISTDTGVNLLDPGDTPSENAQFLLFLCAVIKAVDEYQDLLRISVASASNDHRLGANEAPPAIISMFLGSELTAILEAIASDETYGTKQKEEMRISVHTLPRFFKDTTDRNRTSPFAFTGNKFEFRMPGSQASISACNTVINTIVAEELKQFADELENTEDFNIGVQSIIKRVIKEHKRIIFNGDGYDESWVLEAKERGLLNLKTTPDALAHYLKPKNIELFTRHHVYTQTELEARHEIMLENYCKTVNIEAQTMLDMVRKDILPAMAAYTGELAEVIAKKEALNADLDVTYEKDSLKTLCALMGSTHRIVSRMELDMASIKNLPSIEALANFFKDTILEDMRELRVTVDNMEIISQAKKWPYPSYGSILFSVK